MGKGKGRIFGVDLEIQTCFTDEFGISMRLYSTMVCEPEILGVPSSLADVPIFHSGCQAK